MVRMTALLLLLVVLTGCQRSAGVPAPEPGTPPHAPSERAS